MSVPSLADALSEAGAGVTLSTLRRVPKKIQPHQKSAFRFRLAHTDTRFSKYLPLGWPRSLTRSLHLLFEAAKNRTVLHDNGLWLPFNHVVLGCAHEADVPIIISPRGMLASWSLNAKSWRKKAAWQLYQKADLSRAKVLHATAQSEADEFRACGLTQPIAVIPNGVVIPDLLRVATEPPPLRRALFLSRLHPKKGVEVLLQSWSQARPKGWKLEIVGDGEPDYVRQLEALVRELGMGQDVTFLGPLHGPQKEECFQRCELFVLPSFNENFGIAIAEAMAHALPVITTRSTPWKSLEEHSAGWWVETGVLSITAALTDATSRGSSELKEMGSRGRAAVASNFAWSKVAMEMLSVYQWMLGMGPLPHCVLK